MTLEEMADLLDGLSDFMGKHTAKASLNDLRAVSECFRTFAGESVATFCNFIVQAKAGKAPSRRSAGGIDESKITAAEARIRYFLDHRDEMGFGDIDSILKEIEKLKIPEIQALGGRFQLAIQGRTKKAALQPFRSLLSNVKMSADQTQFSLAASAN